MKKIGERKKEDKEDEEDTKINKKIKKKIKNMKSKEDAILIEFARRKNCHLMNENSNSNVEEKFELLLQYRQILKIENTSNLESRKYSSFVSNVSNQNINVSNQNINFITKNIITLVNKIFYFIMI